MGDNNIKNVSFSHLVLPHLEERLSLSFQFPSYCLRWGEEIFHYHVQTESFMLVSFTARVKERENAWGKQIPPSSKLIRGEEREMLCVFVYRETNASKNTTWQTEKFAWEVQHTLRYRHGLVWNTHRRKRTSEDDGYNGDNYDNKRGTHRSNW